MGFNYPKGATWRRWDLHIHTPESALNSQFGNDWDRYVEALLTRAFEEKIAVVGITDYFGIDGFKKLTQDYIAKPDVLRRLLPNKDDIISHAQSILFLPNIELRLNRLVGSNRINFHIIFAPDVAVGDIEDNFLRELHFDYQAEPQNSHEKRSLTRHNLEALGKRLKSEQAEFQGKSDLIVGMLNAVVSDQELVQILENKRSVFGGKYFLCIPSDEDLSKVSWNSQDHQTRKILIQTCDFLFANNPNTIQWGLGKKHSSQAEFVNEFKTLKPCLTGSDSHSLNDLFKSPSSRNLWIKADPTFDGLRQVLFEPETRVRIQEQQPDEKLQYLVIDSVKFVPHSTSSVFPTASIPINSNLATIIGGKSSGKSLLLHHIAKAVNPEVVRACYKDGAEPYRFDPALDFDFEVTWSDGVTNRIRQDEEERRRRITFIPQMYVNKLVEDEGNHTFHSLIREILLQNDTFRPEYDSFEAARQQLRKDIESLVVDLFGQIQSKATTEESLKALGDKAAVENQAKIIRDEIQKITAEASLSNDEVSTLTSLEDAKKQQQQEMAKVGYLISQHTALKSGLLSTALPTITKTIRERASALQDKGSPYLAEFGKDAGEIVGRISTDVEKTLKEAISKEFSFLEKLERSKDELLARSADTESKLKPFYEKVKSKSRLGELQKNSEQIEKLISQMNGLLARINENDANVASATQKIWQRHERLRELYEGIIRKISDLGVDRVTDDIQLIASITFGEKEFNSSVVSHLDKRLLKSQIPNYYDEDTQSLRGIETAGLQRKIFDAVMAGTLRPRGGGNKLDIVRKLLDDYLSVRFNLKHKGDEIAKMSPGKRGLVVLQLLLHLSNAKEPILIDQPEDNLDNRTIYDELTAFIKTKKTVRQIVMVTHNANLVVAADAEQVIVANQGGENTGQDNRQFKFEYVSGSLENSFKLDSENGMLFKKGIREHVCEILEGGEEAFRTRQKKYSLTVQ